MLNSVNIMGRLVADPELKSTQTGKNVVRIRIACDKDMRDGTDFFDVVAWNKTAEFVSNYFRKGQTIVVVGRLGTHSYEVDGQKRTSTEITADRVYFGGEKKSQETIDEDIPF